MITFVVDTNWVGGCGLIITAEGSDSRCIPLGHSPLIGT